MGIYDNEVMKAVARRSMTIYFIIDTSWSMRGPKIDAVNAALSETVPLIRKISEENADASIQINILTYSTNAQWKSEAPVPVENFKCPIISAGGQSNFRDACISLTNMLDIEKSRAKGAGCYAPVFILMADGGSTNGHKKALSRLWQNDWFSHGIKAAIAIGNEVHFNMLESFTRSKETVLRAHNIKQLKSFIQLVSIHSSKIASQSCMIGSTTNSQNGIHSQPIQNTSSSRRYAESPSSSNLDKAQSRQTELAKTIQLFAPNDDGSEDDFSDW